MEWMSFLNDANIEYVTRGPNTKKGEVSVRCPFAETTTLPITWELVTVAGVAYVMPAIEAAHLLPS
jgi:hypothetical protein